jgi:hypothetical protein
MSGYINDLVPLIRKHFDFLITDWAFECVRTWNEYMARDQGVEYQSDRVRVIIQQPDSPTLDVHFTDCHSDSRFALSLEDIMKEADPELWSRRPRGWAWPRPIEQDDEQLHFLADCTRKYCHSWLGGERVAAPVTRTQ